MPGKLSPRADAHIHLFQHGFSGTKAAGAELTTYIELRERYAIDEALVVGYEGDTRFAGNNDYVLELAATHPWIRPTLFLDPMRPPSPEQIESDRAQGAVGYSIYLGSDPELAGLIPTKTWDALSRARCILSVNAAPEAVAGADTHLRDASGAFILLSHLGLPGNLAGAPVLETQRRIAPIVRLADAPHVSVKLSGLYATDPDFPHTAAIQAAQVLIEAYGPARMLWGSDYAPGLSAVSDSELFALPDIIRDELSESDCALVLGGSLRSILQETLA
ncbi:amidohydrolase family protein [Leucobacter aridicollis]|uniref:amidohydrolase family protein n=1 Tax=Leucobacter aridicollis TaxID=283878 RepID=UPI00210714DA|nr:amidohydrolase family protein [Leucobacter aridicollis]UTX52653.1 amidohydrolase family protein [Leucobacter aridicollis]